MKNNFWLWMVLITLIGGVFRIVGLNKNPVHLGNDEISIAYDSYSVRVTGMDEHRKKMPLSFISHRDYKAPLYAYFNIPFNYVIGNNEYGVRLLSAMVGTLAIFLIALVGKELAGDKIGIMSAILLALNPKSIFVSRAAYESNLASVILLLGIYLVLIYKRKRRMVELILAGFFFGLSIWAYHTEKGLVPLLLIACWWCWKKEIKFKNWLPLWLVTILVSLPIFYDFVMVQMRDPFNRASSQIWFKTAGVQNYWLNNGDFWIKKLANILVEPVYNYGQHFGLDFLFTNGMDLFPKNEPFNFGWFLLATAPFLFFGLANLKKVFKDKTRFILMWWLLCPLVPALTGSPASVRNLPFIMPTILIMAVGVKVIFEKSKKFFWWLVLLGLINFAYFGVAYYVHFPKITGDNYQYGYKQAFEEIKPVVNDYKWVVIEPRFGEFGQYVGLPRLYLGYWGAFDAWEMINRTDESGKIGKYWIKNIDWNQEDIDKETMYVVSVSNPTVNEAISKLELWKTIYKPDRKAQFLIYISKK